MTFREILYSVIIPVLSGLFGGGAVSAYIEWRRFQKEQQVDRQKLDINIIQGSIFSTKWRAAQRARADERLYIFDNGLNDTVRSYDTCIEFGLTNLTDQELLITDMGFEIEAPLPEPPRIVEYDEYGDATTEAPNHIFTTAMNGVPYYLHVPTGARFWDNHGYFYISTKNEINPRDYITLPAKGTLAIAYRSLRHFFAQRTLERPPEELIIRIRLASGQEITKPAKLQSVNNPLWRVKYELLEPVEQSDLTDEEDIPF